MRAWQANIVGLGVAGLVIGGGLILGAPDAVAGGPSRPQTLGAVPSVGDNTGEIPFGDNMQLWGRPSRLGVFWTNDPIDKIVETFSDAWTSAGMTPKVLHIDKVTAVSALDTGNGPGSGLMRSVTIIDQGKDRMVVPGVMDMRVPPDTSARHAPVPVPETAVAYNGQTADDSGSVSYTGSYEVPLRSGQVIDFYKRELGKDKYEISKPMKHITGGASIEFMRGPEWISVVARDDEAMKAPLDDKPAVKSNAKGQASALPLDFAQVIVTHVRTIESKPEWKP